MPRQNAGRPLPDDEYDALLLSRIGGMSVREAAKARGLSTATVRKHAPGKLIRALRRISGKIPKAA